MGRDGAKNITDFENWWKKQGRIKAATIVNRAQKVGWYCKSAMYMVVFNNSEEPIIIIITCTYKFLQETLNYIWPKHMRF